MIDLSFSYDLAWEACKLVQLLLKMSFQRYYVPKALLSNHQVLALLQVTLWADSCH
jgi:hypothetical protein